MCNYFLVKQYGSQKPESLTECIVKGHFSFFNLFLLKQLLKDNTQMKKISTLFLFLICSATVCFSQIKLPRFFSDSMVLQRNTDAVIWGTDIGNTKIIVSGSWGKTDSVVSDNAGKWKLKLQTPAAGGPFTLTANGSTTVTVKDVQIGEVWLCAGQSNMEMPMKGYSAQPVDSSAFFIANSLNPLLRVYMSGWNGTSRVPVNELSVGAWETASPETTRDFSATAYFFARKIQETLGIPVGVIVTARGGSNIESWMDSVTLSTVKPVVIPTPVRWQDAQITPTILYNTMLHPFIGLSMKGIIWSQGEGNRGNYQEYQTMFTKLINSWRTQWNQGEFPFYFAQVAPNGGTANINAAGLREAQLNTMLTISATGMANTMDIGTQGQDHYPKKKVVGDRLAQWALIKDYGRTGTLTGPVVKSVSIKNDTINLKFDYTAMGLLSSGTGFADFEIAGANRVFFPATVSTADFNYSLNIKSSSVSNPLYVNYAFKNFAQGSLFNSAGFPASSFRTENILAVLPVKFGNISVANKNGVRTITWKTLVESNIDGYEVQSSVDGIHFTTITKIPAKGSNNDYRFEDNTNVNNKTVYYRIKAMNTSGENDYSRIVKHTFYDVRNDIKIMNPSYSGVNVFCRNSFTGSIVICDNTGKRMATKQINKLNGAFKIALPLTFKGTAVVHIITPDNDQHTTLVNIL